MTLSTAENRSLENTRMANVNLSAAGDGVTRRTIASYTTYAEAQRAVDHLSDAGFAVRRVAIVAEGLSFVEQVTGRLNWGRAALNGALSGASTGFFLGFILGFLSLVAPAISALVVALYGLVIGAVIGAIFGLLYYAFSGGQRDFTSVGGIRADHYNIMVDADVANEAEGLLRDLR